MKKINKIVSVILISSMFITACKPITEDKKLEQEAKSNNSKKEQVVYDTVDDLDYSGTHIKGMLKKNFRVDAKIPKYIPEVVGDYEMSSMWKYQDEDRTDEFVKLVDDYLGYDDTITMADIGYEKTDFSEMTAIADGVSGMYRSSKIPREDNYWRMEFMRESLPEYGQYNKDFIDPIVNEFLEAMAPFVPDGIDGTYSCVHFEDSYKNYINNKYGEKSPYLFSWTKPLLYEEFYIVRLEPQIEGIGFKSMNNRIGYAAEDGYTYDDVFRYLGADDSVGFGASVMSSVQFLDLYINAEGEVFSFNYCYTFDIEEKIGENRILQPKDMIEIVYKEYEDVLLLSEMVVTEMNLNYLMVMGEPDENKFVNAYLTPTWEVYVYDKLNKKYYQYVYSAVTGEMLKVN